MNPRPTILVLAIGHGQPLGADGHALVQPPGLSTVLTATIQHAIETRWPVAVVTTSELVPIVSPWIATRDLVVLSPGEAARGMGFAIASGVAAQAAGRGWLVLPGDMPLVRPASMQTVGRALAEHPIAYAQHRGRQGHPVGFAAELFSELIGLNGDDGARRLMARYPALPLELDDPGVLIDVDTEADLAAARAAAGVA